MTNIVQHQTGVGEPHASNHGLAAGELAIKQKATNHTTAASGKLYYGEDVSDTDSTSSTLRTFGIGILAGDDSDQSQTGVPIGGNVYFKEGSNMTISQGTSGDVVTLTFASSGGSANDSTITLTAGDGLKTGGSFTTNASGNSEITFNFDASDVAGTGLTANGENLDVAAAQTTITSIYATDLIIGEDSQTAIDFGTANEIDFKVDNANRLTLTSGALFPATNNQIDLGTASLEFKNAYFDGTVTTDSVSIGGHTINAIDASSEASNANDHLMTALAIKNRIEDFGYTTDANVTHRPITAGGNSVANGETLVFTAGTGISISESGGAVTITNSVSDTTLSTENVQDIAGGMFAGNTETGITATYQDGDGTIDLVVGTLNQDTTGNAATATAIAITDESSDSTCFPVFATTTTGNRTLHSGSNFTFDANTGEVGATTFNPTSGFTIGTGDGGGHTINNVDIAGEWVDSDEHLMTSAAINDRINAISTNNSGDITNVGVTSPITGGGSSGSVTIAIQDASTSAKGAAQFSSSYFSASSGTISIKDDGIDSDQIAAGAIDIAHLSASGSASGSTYLRGDNTWAAVSGGSSLTVGSDNQIPVVNSGGDDLEYTSNFTYDGTKLTIIGDTNNALLELRSTDDDANEGPVMNFFRTSGSGADDDIGGAIQWNFTDEGAWGPTLMGSISMKVEDETVSSKDSHFMIKTYKGNTLYNLQIGATGATSAWAIKPSAANTLYLGSSSYDLNRSYVRSYYGHDGSGYSAGATSANASGPTAFLSSNGTDVGTGAAAQLTFASAGGIVVLGDVQPAPSDSRYKENVADLDKGLTFLESLPSAKTFDFKDAVKEIGVKEPKKGELGFLAQDIEKILPDVVVTAKDENSEFGEFKTISYPDLDKTIIYSLINAVKELSAKVKALEDA